MTTQSRKTAWIGLLLLIAVYALDIIPRHTISAEIGLAYATFSAAGSLRQVLGTFLVFTENWYRPFTFHLTNYLIFHAIDIHDYRLIKTLSFCVVLLNVYVATILQKVIFGSNRIERALVFALILTHPSYYSIIFEGSGMVDPIFTIFLNIALICLIRVSQNFLNPADPTLTKRQIVLASLVSCICILGAITSQERGLAIFPMMGVIYLFYHWPRRGMRLRIDPAASAILLFAVATACLYIQFVVRAKTHWQTTDYRTSFEPDAVGANLIKVVEFPLRLFFHKMGKAYDAHMTLIFNLFALPFIAATIAYVLHIVRARDREELARIGLLMGIFLCALPLPVMFGGNTWHFYTASLYFSFLMGRATWFWIQKAAPRLQPPLLAAFFLWLGADTLHGIHEELGPRTEFFQYMSLVPAALADPVLMHPPFIPQVVYYDTGSYGDFIWPFGGEGNLFKYLYRDPRIIEIALVHGKVLDADLPLCALAKDKTSLAFGFDSTTLSWSALNTAPCPR